MSPLTKLFVVLLVVLSLLLSAALVVFSMAIPDYRAANATLKAQLDAATNKASNLENELVAVRESSRANLDQSRAQMEELKRSFNSIQQEIGKVNVDKAEIASTLAMRSADVTRLTEALKASEDTKSKLQEQVGSLRNVNDERLKQNAELNLTVTDLSNRLAVTERERQFLAEQLTEARNTNERLSSALKEAGVDVSRSLATAGLGRGAPPINAVVRSVRTIANLPYATISVGSADSVRRGMEFKLVNRETGEFLGVLTVDSVEPNESTGRLSGPRIVDVRPGVEARTQL